jgi:hypothetical protein
MTRTLIVFDNPELLETVVKPMSLILGPSKYCRMSEFKDEYKAAYQYFVIGGAADASGKTGVVDSFISANRQWLGEKQVALFARAENPVPAAAGLVEASQSLGLSVPVEVIPGTAGHVDIAQVVEAAMRLRSVRPQKRMDPAEVKKRIEAILSKELYLILGTASGARVRATTIGYTYKDGYVYFFAEGSEKYANLLLNPHVSLALYTFPEKEGVQLSGTASILYPGSKEYEEMCRLLGRDHQRYLGLAFLLNGIAIKLHKGEYYRGTLGKEGYETKQACYF